MKIRELLRKAVFILILAAVGGVAFAAGLAWSSGRSHAFDIDEVERPAIPADIVLDRLPSAEVSKGGKAPNVLYPKRTDLDFEGLKLQGELRNPGEFYFQHRTEEKFDSLVKRRKNFHQEMLRDAVLSK